MEKEDVHICAPFTNLQGKTEEKFVLHPQTRDSPPPPVPQGVRLLSGTIAHLDKLFKYMQSETLTF